MNWVASVFYMFLCFACCLCLCPVSFIVTCASLDPKCCIQEYNMNKKEKKMNCFLMSLYRSKKHCKKFPSRPALTSSLAIGKPLISLWQSHWDYHKLCKLSGFTWVTLGRVDFFQKNGVLPSRKKRVRTTVINLIIIITTIIIIIIVTIICWGVTSFETRCWTVEYTPAFNKHGNPVTDEYTETQLHRDVQGYTGNKWQRRREL